MRDDHRGAGPACTCGVDLVQESDDAHDYGCARLTWLRDQRSSLLTELRSCPPDRAVTLIEAFDAVTDELAAADPARAPSSRRAARQQLRRSLRPS